MSKKDLDPRYMNMDNTVPRNYSNAQNNAPQSYSNMQNNVPQGYPNMPNNAPQSYLNIQNNVPQGYPNMPNNAPQGYPNMQNNNPQGYRGSQYMQPRYIQPKKKKSGVAVFLIVMVVLTVVVAGVLILMGKSGDKDGGRNNGSSDVAEGTSSQTDNTFVNNNNSDKIELDKPTLNWFVSGEYMIVTWDDVENATEYKYSSNSKCFTTNKTAIAFKMDEGDTKRISVFATNSSDRYKDSKTSSIEVTMPSVKFSLYTSDYVTASLSVYSLDKAVNWAKTDKCKEYLVEETDEYTILTVRFPENDSILAAAWSRLKRGLTGLVSGLFDGAREGVEQIDISSIAQDLNNLFNSDHKITAAINTAIDVGGAIDDAGSVEDYAAIGAVTSAIGYLFDDVDIYYTFYYEKGRTDFGPVYMTIQEEKKGREDLKEQFAQKWATYSDCFISKSNYYNRDYIVYLDEDKSNVDYPRWVMVFYPYPAPAGTIEY
ncbi:MAG: hypothetical protein K5750_06555 [Eubacterium sp.]|nr:hypothetical protein [Eubacterium sp.]